MLRKSGAPIYADSVTDTDALVLLIRDSYIPAFEKLCDTLIEKAEQGSSPTWEG